MSTEVLILGAGYGGLTAAIALERKLRQGADLRLTLVDRNPYHTLMTLLHEVIGNTVFPESARIPLEDILYHRQITLVQAAVQKLDLAAKQVITDAGPLSYDRLILALGGEMDYYDIPGLAKHSWSIWGWEQTRALQSHIIQTMTAALAEPDKIRRREMLTFVVGGGGLTGCEVAASLRQYTQRLAKIHQLPQGAVRVMVVEAQDHLLPAFQRDLAPMARHLLAAIGVRPFLGEAIVGVDSSQIYLSSGNLLRAATLIWTGGIRGPNLLKDANLKMGEGNRLLVDRWLHVRHQDGTSCPDISAVGDCAITHQPFSRRGMPASAQLAHAQGQSAAEILVNDLRGEPSLPYYPVLIGEVMALGADDGLGWVGPLRFTGFTAQVLKRITLQRYLNDLGGMRVLDLFDARRRAVS
ncbi:MAG: NAD(P)/FAD-dependent oxidoreductase [Chloroflexi bacterium]|nr:NAD(P)/FAD-dependent oxidoreductase [Chloroflexota bacterium]